MGAFVWNNVKRLFSLTYLFTTFLYISFAWMLSSPPFDFSAIYKSQRIIDSYNFVLMSIGFLTFLLIIISHFRETLQPGKKEIFLSRFTKRKTFWYLIISYVSFFFIGYTVPFYSAAMLLQLVLASFRKIDIIIFFINSVNVFTGYSLFWIIFTIILFAKYKNEFVVLFVILIAYGLANFLYMYSQGVIFNNNWFNELLSKNLSEKVIQSFLIWAGFTILIIIFVSFVSKNIVNRDFTGTFKKGLFVKITEKLNFDISAYHLKMIGLGTLKLLTIFTFLGLIQIIILISLPNANLLPFAKIYIGAFLPILFSFNQYYIVDIDREAGMIHNNFLRKMSFRNIVFNRWFILLIPQIIIAIFFLIILSTLGKTLPLSFIFYVLLLNIFCSSLNLFFGILTGKTGLANFILLFIIYIQLRQDFQDLLAKNSLLNDLNIFSPLLNLNSSSVGLLQFTIVISTISLCIYLTYIILDSDYIIKYNNV